MATPARTARVPGDAFPVDPDLAGGGRGEPGQDGQQAGLAGPGRPDDGQAAPFGHGQVHAVQDELARPHVTDPRASSMTVLLQPGPVQRDAVRRSGTARTSVPGGSVVSSTSVGSWTEPSLRHDQVILARLALGPDPPVADGDRAVQGVAHHRVVGHHHHGGAFGLVGRTDQVQDRGGRGPVELAGRLVGQQQPGPVGQGHRHGQPLLFAAGRARPAWRWATRARPMASSSSAVRRRLAARPGWAGRCANMTLPVAVSLASRLRPGFCRTTPTSCSRRPRPTGGSGR